MQKKIRLLLALSIFLVSLSLLVWASLPAIIERREFPIPSDDLQLPTPSAFIYYGEV